MPAKPEKKMPLKPEKPAKISLPKQAAQPATPAPKPASPEGAKIKALIIDDDAFIAGMYATRLITDGFAVVTASDGLLGLEKAKQELPDIILLDVLMPKMDGFETLSRLKAEPSLAAIPVLMLTSMGQKEDVARGLEGGAVDYMIKTTTLPVDASDKIKKVLDQAKKS